MGILTLFGKIGNRLGLIRVVEVKDPAKPQKVTTRTITLSDLAGQVRSEQVRALAELPAELAVPFEKVFEAAGVKPPAHGWTIPRLQELLATDQYKTLARPAAQQAILGLLATQKAPVDDLVKDAVDRDQALDAYEVFVHKKLESRQVARQQRTEQIHEQIRQLQAETARLAEENKNDQEQFAQWHTKKVACEKDLAAAVGYLLDKAVVSVDADE